MLTETFYTRAQYLPPDEEDSKHRLVYEIPSGETLCLEIDPAAHSSLISSLQNTRYGIVEYMREQKPGSSFELNGVYPISS